MSDLTVRNVRWLAGLAAIALLPAPSVAAATAAPVPQNAAEWIGQGDYPAAALAQDLGGAVGFVAIVGRDGLVTECRVERSSGIAALDLATCRLIAKRARFVPARDDRGRKVRGTYASTVVWNVDQIQAPAPG